MATQATDRLEVVDFMPAVEKLWNDRYRLTFYCRISDKKEDWIGGNVSTFLPAFGELQGANFTGDGWSPRDGEEYSDMRLVEAGAPYISASGEHLVTLVYETISDTFTQEVDDKTNKPKNGLRGVTRKSIAKSGTEYTGEIGVTTIQHQVNQEAEITLYLAQVEIEDTDAYRRVTEVWLESGILSLQQELVGGATTVQVNALGLTETQVNALLSEVTASHVLISQSESDYDGIKTSTFQYQLDESFTEDYELNGLKRISLIELSTTNFTATSIGSQGATATPQFGLYLATQDIDNGGTIKFRESTWLEAGTLNVQRRSESEGVYRVTTTFLGVEGSVVGPIVARVEDDYEGLKTITVVSMQDASGASLVAVASQPVASHSTLSEFSYPGVVTISAVTLAGTGTTFSFDAKDFSLKPPVVSRVPATIKVSFKTTSAISYTGTGGLWNPTTWAEGSSKGIAWSYLPFSIARGFRGYRTDPNATNSYSDSGSSSNTKDMISGKRIFAGTSYSIQVSGGPPDPVGNQYTLDYSVSLAFEDVSGVPYYKHKEIVSTIPSQ